MFIISGEKGTGKTRALLDKAKLEDAVVVCENPATMRIRAHGYGIAGLELVSYSDFYANSTAYADKPVFIHDINKFMRYGFINIKGYSMNLN